MTEEYWETFMPSNRVELTPGDGAVKYAVGLTPEGALRQISSATSFSGQLNDYPALVSHIRSLVEQLHEKTSG